MLFRSAEDLIKKSLSATKYRNRSSLTGSYGLAVYYPYKNPEAYKDVMAELRKISCNGTESFFNQFLSIMTGSNSGNQNGLYTLLGYEAEDQNWNDQNWFDDSVLEEYDYQTIATTDELIVDYDESYDAFVLSLLDDEWETKIGRASCRERVSSPV